MKISIALGTYNCEAYLQEQLDSFLLQTRLPDEIIVGDDGSSDNTLQILKEFTTNAPFSVRVKKNRKNLGVIRNFDQIIDRCSGDIIFPSDHDDVWMSTKIEKIVAEFEKKKQVGIVFTDAELTDEKLKTLGSTLWDKIFPVKKQKDAEEGRVLEVLLDRNVIGGATSAFRADFRRFFSPIPTHLSWLHDGWIALIIASMAEIRFLQEPLIKYRQHTRQETKAIWGKKDESQNQKFSRKMICEQGEEIYKKKKQELLFFLETLERFTNQENTILNKSLRVIESKIQEADYAKDHFSVRRNLPSGFKRLYQIGNDTKTEIESLLEYDYESN